MCPVLTALAVFVSGTTVLDVAAIPAYVLNLDEHASRWEKAQARLTSFGLFRLADLTMLMVLFWTNMPFQRAI